MKAIILILFLVSTNLNAAVWYYGSGEATSLENVLGFDKLPNVKVEASGLNLLMRPDAGGQLLVRSNTDLDNEAGKQFSGPRNFYVKGDADYAKTTDFTSGNNASFDGGGALSGVFSISTLSTDVIDSDLTRTFKYTQAAGSLNDYIASTVIDIPLGYRGKLLGYQFKYKYDGGDDDLNIIVFCATGTPSSTVLSSFGLPAYSGSGSKLYESVTFIPSGCTQLKVGLQVAVLNSGKILTWDQGKVIPDPTLLTSVASNGEHAFYNSEAGLGSTNTKIPYFTTQVYDTFAELATISNSSTLGFSFTANKRIKVTMSYWQSAASTSFVGISKNSTQLSTRIDIINTNDRVSMGASGGSPDQVTFTGILNPGDVLRPHIDNATNSASRCGIEIVATEVVSGVITSTEAPVNEYTARVANNGTATVTSESVTGWIDSVSRISLGHVTVDYTSLGLSVIPKITLTAEDNDSFVTITAISTTAVTYSVLNNGGTDEDRNVNIDLNLQGTDYKDLTANLIQTVPKIAYIKDVKSSGTNGGTFTSGSYVTRDLNTLEGDTSFATVVSNQIILAPGLYDIYIDAPAHRVNQHKVKLYNITTASDEIIGMPSFNDTASSGNYSRANGRVQISSETIFEVRHRCSVTRATDGLGRPTSYGDVETYTTVKIIKLK